MKKFWSRVFILVSCFLVLASLAIRLEVKALVMPSVHPLNLNLSQTSFNAQDVIKGNFEIKNDDSEVVAGIKYRLQLLGNLIDGVPNTTYFELKDSSVFALNPGAATKINFKLPLPAGLTGDLIFRVALFNNQGLPFGWEDKNITIKGISSFVTLADAYFIFEKSDSVEAGAGPLYNPNESPLVEFKVQSTVGGSFVPKITLYRTNVDSGNVVNSYDDAKFDLVSGISKTVNLKLPALSAPQVYMASVALYRDKKLASTELFYRWVIEGANANIWQVTADKGSYKAGDQAQVNIVYTGSADAHTVIGSGTVKISILTKTGEIAGEKTVDINLDNSGKSVPVAIDIKKDVSFPSIKSEIVKDNQVIATHQVSLENKNRSASVLSYWLVVLLALAALIFALLKFFKKNKIINPSSAQPPVTPLIIFLLLTSIFYFLGVPTVHANVIVEDEGYKIENTGCGAGFDGMGINWNTPRHQTPPVGYNLGDTITFSGNAWAISCGNSFKFAYISIYITDDHGENQITVVDNKYMKRLEGGVQRMEYNIPYTIPLDFPLSGKLRAYAKFTAKFHHTCGGIDKEVGIGWVTAYEHINLNNSDPSAILSINNQITTFSSPLIVVAPGNYSVSWQSWNTTACFATAPLGWTTSVSTSGSQSFSNIVTGTYNYQITCNNTAGSSTSVSGWVNVIDTTPKVFLRVNNATSAILAPNETAVLTWRAFNVNSCFALPGVPGWSGNKSTSTGSENTSQAAFGSYVYKLRCNAPTTEVTDQVEIQIMNKPICDFQASSSKINQGDTAELIWSCQNVIRCDIDGSRIFGPVNVPASTTGSIFTPSLIRTTLFTLTCNNFSFSKWWPTIVEVVNSGYHKIIEVPP